MDAKKERVLGGVMAKHKRSSAKFSKVTTVAKHWGGNLNWADVKIENKLTVR